MSVRQLQNLFCTVSNSTELHRANVCMDCEREGRITAPTPVIVESCGPYGRAYKPERKRSKAIHPRGVTRSFTLTPRELEIVGLLARGMQSIDIARELKVSRANVSSMIGNAATRLGLEGLAELKAYARGMMEAKA